MTATWLEARARWVALGMAATCASGCGSCAGGSDDSAKRPSTREAASIPAEYVRTPFGYMHPSCIRRAGGNPASDAPCEYPRYAPSGRAVAPSAAAQGWEWVLAPSTALPAGSAGLGTYSGLVFAANPPTSFGDGQYVYFFGWLMPADRRTIIQPVIGWYGGGWHAFAAYYDNTGHANYGPEVAVAVHDLIDWSIAGSGCSPQGVCTTWTVTLYDDTACSKTAGCTRDAGAYLGMGSCSCNQFNSSIQVAGNMLGQPMTSAGIGMEEYDVATCADYPASAMDFGRMTLLDTSPKLVDIQWSFHEPDAGAAGCGWTASQNPGEIILLSPPAYPEPSDH